MTAACEVLAAFSEAAYGARSFPVGEERRLVYSEKASGRSTTAVVVQTPALQECGAWYQCRRLG